MTKATSGKVKDKVAASVNEKNDNRAMLIGWVIAVRLRGRREGFDSMMEDKKLGLDDLETIEAAGDRKSVV